MNDFIKVFVDAFGMLRAFNKKGTAMPVRIILSTMLICWFVVVGPMLLAMIAVGKLFRAVFNSKPATPERTIEIQPTLRIENKK